MRILLAVVIAIALLLVISHEFSPDSSWSAPVVQKQPVVQSVPKPAPAVDAEPPMTPVLSRETPAKQADSLQTAVTSVNTQASTTTKSVTSDLDITSQTPEAHDVYADKIAKEKDRLKKIQGTLQDQAAAQSNP